MPPVFWIWAAWRDKGGIPANRPKGLPDRIPASWWARYLIHKGLKPKPPNVAPAQYILFADAQPELALQAPSKYGVALSADKAFRDPRLADTIAALRFKGHRVIGWCDCDVAKGTSAADGLAFVQEYGLDYFIGQAESPEQFDEAFGHGAHVIVGNLTALRGDQVAKIDQHQILWIQEDFWNEGWALLRDSRVAAVMHGVYPTSIWNPTIAQYLSAGRWKPGDGLFHVASVTDWSDLP